MALGGQELRAHSKPVRWSAQHRHLGHHKQGQLSSGHKPADRACLRLCLRVFVFESQQTDISGVTFDIFGLIRRDLLTATLHMLNTYVDWGMRGVPLPFDNKMNKIRTPLLAAISVCVEC